MEKTPSRIKEVVIATKNRKKFEEIKRLFKKTSINVLSLKDLPRVPRIIENRETFRENAAKKALAVSGITESLVLADDSGLEVPALGGRPGVRSSRYAGPKKDDRLNCLKLLKEMRGFSFKERRARFNCAVAIAHNGRLIKVLEGACSGRIGFKMEGDSGFGYDPVFIPLGYKETFALLGPKVKDRLSHRAKALEKAKGFIVRYLSKGL